MQIGIVAKKIGLSIDAIRFYERNGLLPWSVPIGGYRSIAPTCVWLGGMRTSSASHQDCCHRSPAKSAATAATSTVAMASFNRDDVRTEFNASGEKVRVVALLSPTCPGASLDMVVGR